MNTVQNKVIFFDTETTGNTERDFMCQIAYKTGNESFTSLYKPSKKIPPEASAVHHITNKMVGERSSFRESGHLGKIKELFENENSIVVAHNAPFDLMIAKKEGIEPKKFICTLRVARHLHRDDEIDRYNLQYLRYFLEIEIDATAHDALGDVLVLEKLYEMLKKKMMEDENLSENEAVEKMMEISARPSLLRKFNFGKHTGKKIEDVAIEDRGYLEWLLKQKLGSNHNDEDWIYTLRHHLEKKTLL